MIRRIRPADVPAVLALIGELAAYELEPDAVEASEADLQQAFFGPDPSVFAHVAVRSEGSGPDDAADVVGAAIWCVNFSTWTGHGGVHLIDLIVAADARGDGYGRALFSTLAALCVERGYRRLDWETADRLLDGRAGADHPGAHEFYRSLGGRPRDEWTPWRLEGDALDRFATGSGGSER